MYQTVTFYRAVCFAKPVAPWRISREHAQRDAESEGLGSFDEWGSFYVTVPGDIEVMTLSAHLIREAAQVVEGRRAA